jgi:hypothetical protein
MVNTTKSVISFSGKSDISILSIASSPGVSYQPVVTKCLISAIANKHNDMVHIDVLSIVAAIEDATLILVPV